MAKSKNGLKKFYSKLLKAVSSPYFFVLSLVLFVFQAGWVAFSGVFPLPYDEDTHLTIIKFFAAHPNPFFTSQPTYLDASGPVAHDPSYLYRYIMSFPWRLITAITSNYQHQIVAMRLINIAMMVAGIYLFRLLLLKIIKNRLVVNIALLIFVLTPIVSQLAAQINYDNLLLPLIALSFLLTLKAIDSLRQGKLDAWQLGTLLSLLFISALVKNTFLTILVAIVAYVGWLVVAIVWRQRHKLKALLAKSVNGYSRAKLVWLTTLVLLSGGLFLQRYGYNIIRYHNPAPGCVAIIGTERCKAYGVYNRSQIYADHRPEKYNKNPFYYTYLWAKHMNYTLMFALNGPAGGYAIGRPITLPFIAMTAFLLVGLVAVIICWRQILFRSTGRLIALAIAVYLFALWLLNYTEYLHTGRRVAVSGRYLVPFLPFIFAAILMFFANLLRKLPKLRAGFVGLLVVLLSLGGGVGVFILHSDNSWYWPDSSIVSANQTAQKVLKPFVLPKDRQYSPYYQSSLEF